MKIAILGAGWFGCHIASILKKKNYVDLYESKNQILSSTSSYNTNRLHHGFHYPRSEKTRSQCVNNFDLFKKEYPNICTKVKKNIIAIHNKSKIDLKNYKNILKKSGLTFEDLKKNELGLKNMQGSILCDEELIRHDLAKKELKKRLKGVRLYLKYKVKNFKNNLIGKKKYDWIIDCTANSIKDNFDNVYFEPRITLVYKSKLKNFALMVMDGNFWCIYPRGKTFYTLGSVIYSRISKPTKSLKIAKKNITEFINKKISQRVSKFEKQVEKDFPEFKSYFTYHKFYKSICSLYVSKSDNRPLLIKRKKKVISVLGGKIDTVIQAGNQINKIINS